MKNINGYRTALIECKNGKAALDDEYSIFSSSKTLRNWIGLTNLG
jgi:hypothetical protein